MMACIGVDLSSLQGPHRMRGIGYTLINFINGLTEKDKANNSFVFYAYTNEDTGADDPLSILDLDNINYEVRYIRSRRRSTRKLPGKLNMLVSAYNNLIEIKDLYIGDSRIKNLRGVDVFLQTDQSQSLPRKFGMKKALIIYDIIPYVLEWDYLWSYRTARRIHGFSRKASLRVQVRRWLYAYKIKINVRRANLLLSISESTKDDFVNLLGISSKKIVVTPLGVHRPAETSVNRETRTLHQYKKTSWGYMKRPLDLTDKIPYILFVGGADKRRKLQDLVTAFNHLRSEGHELKLILAGDSMQGYDDIATEEIQYALKTSSYLEDIIFMGFVNDDDRDYLYKHALAFVFPSRYEGFGLPVLEAMMHDCLVISYGNEATKEVALSEPIYVNSALELSDAILKLLNSSTKELDSIRQRNKIHANKYSWEKTSKRILSVITS